jgi:1-acyl-sn-glycerol-3-phosphate acyltransferase
MAVRRRRPSAGEIATARALLAPWRWVTAPSFFHVERVPRSRPVLLVGNHTLMGLLDVPLMVLELLERREVFPRALGDHIHFRIPGWRDLLAEFGTVEGSRESCAALMRARETILVFPGGAREVFKRKGESYTLQWGDRSGFARLAVEHGYTILPFAALGADDCFDILFDAGDLLATPLGRLIERVVPRAKEMPPLVRGIGPLPLPRPQRFYFHFGKPIETGGVAGRHEDAAVCAAVRNETRAAIERGLRFLERKRADDPDKGLVARALEDLRRAAGLP